MDNLAVKVRVICDKLRRVELRRLFAQDPERFSKYSIRHAGLLVDFSKNWLLDDTLPELCSIAREANVERWRDLMFSGEKINNTEHRAALHTALRNRNGNQVMVDHGIQRGVNLVTTYNHLSSIAVSGG